MITFNEKDFKITEVKTESKISNLLTKYEYYIYGLKQEDNPGIFVEYHFDKVDEYFEERLQILEQFFSKNGIIFEWNCESDSSNRVSIGIRRDLRSVVNGNGKPLFAASLISTVIYGVEGRLQPRDLKSFKIPKLPALSKLLAEKTKS